MKNLKKVVAFGLSAAMIASSLVACGNKEEGGSSTGNGATGPVEYTYTPVTSDDGKTLNIYTWNTEFLERFVDYYPDYVANDEEDLTKGGKIGDVEVKFITVSNEGNAYQDNLDSVLLKNGDGQANASAEDKIDIFLVEADYALKYTDTNYTLALKDAGVDESKLGDQYKYTKDAVTDGKGLLKGSSWQGCPGALIYRADIAEKVFGTSEPADIQAKVKDWDTFLATAKELKDAGVKITATSNDAYRVFSNNVTSKWVVDGKLNVDKNIENWVTMSKEMVDNGYTDTYQLWSDEWNAGMKTDAQVFCYFGPAWLIDFSMHAGEEGYAAHDGLYKVTEGPQGFFWGGTWVCAANGTDNASLVADIITKMTTDDDILAKIIEEKHDFVNDSKLVDKYATDGNFGDAVLGGQNPLATFSKGVSTVDLSNISSFDQGCNETFQEVMKDYFDGNYASYDEALASFKTKIKDKYPVIVVE